MVRWSCGIEHLIERINLSPHPPRRQHLQSMSSMFTVCPPPCADCSTCSTLTHLKNHLDHLFYSRNDIHLMTYCAQYAVSRCVVNSVSYTFAARAGMRDSSNLWPGFGIVIVDCPIILHWYRLYRRHPYLIF